MQTETIVYKLNILKDRATAKKRYYLDKAIKENTLDYQTDYKYFTAVEALLIALLKDYES